MRTKGRIIFAIILAAILTYGLAAFTDLELDFRNWSRSMRLDVVTAWIVEAAVIVFAIILPTDEQGKLR